MGRLKKDGVQLPDGVQRVVKPNGRVYYYFAPRRGTAKAGGRIALGSDPRDPEFWRRLKEATGGGAGLLAGSWSALITAYKASPEWGRLRMATQRCYESRLEYINVIAGHRMVADMQRSDIYALRDGLSATPTTANLALSVLRLLLEWSIPRGFRSDNPAVGVPRLKKDDDGGAHPWPEAAYAYVIGHAPEDLKRMAFLGRATGQRESNLIKMSAAHLADDGISLRIGKLRDKKHFVPLTRSQMEEIGSWGVTGMDVFLKSPRGRPYNEVGLRQRWIRWRGNQDALKDIKLTIHGLRATAVVDRRMDGAPDGSVADELGMSVAMVSRYARFADKAAAARASRDRREGKNVVKIPTKTGNNRGRI